LFFCAKAINGTVNNNKIIFFILIDLWLISY
jgi:hypothetical protein